MIWAGRCSRIRPCPSFPPTTWPTPRRRSSPPFRNNKGSAMAILVNRNTRVMTQGITGKTGQFHTIQCLNYAFGRECFVAGVTPKKGGQEFEGVPIFDTVKEAKE